MIVLDASATVDWLLQTPAGQRIEGRIYARKDTLHTVHLLDVEVAQVLRRVVREGTLARKRAEEAMEDLIAVRVTRYAPVLFCPLPKLRGDLLAGPVDFGLVYAGQRKQPTAVLFFSSFWPHRSSY